MNRAAVNDCLPYENFVSGFSFSRKLGVHTSHEPEAKITS